MQTKPQPGARGIRPIGTLGATPPRPTPPPLVATEAELRRLQAELTILALTACYRRYVPRTVC